MNFFENAVTKSCIQVMSYLGKQPFIHNYYLAGGTALALQIGHRVSTDLDWFSTSDSLLSPERETICQLLKIGGKLDIISEQDGQLFTRLFDVDVSFIHQPHKLLNPTVEYENIQLAGPADIGLMKLAAINSRGTRRDFIDIYCLQEIIKLDELLDLVTVKYHDRPSFLAITIRALAYFEDAEQQPMPDMLKSLDWNNVKKYCETCSRQLARRLSGLS